MMNPYSGQGFGDFFSLWLGRFYALLTGGLSWQNLASDEIQIFVLASIAASAAWVGSFLVFRKMTMLANSLSHTVLLGLVLAFLLTSSGEGHHHEGLDLQVMVLAAFLSGTMTTFFTQLLTSWLGLQEDASIGLVFSLLFALGIILVTLYTKNSHIGAEIIMGNVDAVGKTDLRIALYLLASNFILFFLFFKEYSLTTFDPAYAKSLGLSPLFFHYLLMIQASATVVGGFRAVGVIMVLAFLVIPSLIARLFSTSLFSHLLLATCIGAGASLVGVAVARHCLSEYFLALSTGGVVVCVLVLFYGFALCLNFGIKRRRSQPLSS